MVKFWVYFEGRTNRICLLIGLRVKGREVKNDGKVAGFQPGVNRRVSCCLLKWGS